MHLLTPTGQHVSESPIQIAQSPAEIKFKHKRGLLIKRVIIVRMVFYKAASMLNLCASCCADVSRATVTIGGDRGELEYSSALRMLDSSTATVCAVSTGTVDQR